MSIAKAFVSFKKSLVTMQRASKMSTSSKPSTGSSSYQVQHDECSQKYTMNCGQDKGLHAFINYRKLGNGKIDMYHTEVPYELRGRGLGRLIAQGALELAARDNLRVTLTCEFLQDYVNKYADQKLKAHVDS